MTSKTIFILVQTTFANLIKIINNAKCLTKFQHKKTMEQLHAPLISTLLPNI